jgi:hypothetical protein
MWQTVSSVEIEEWESEHGKRSERTFNAKA